MRQSERSNVISTQTISTLRCCVRNCTSARPLSTLDYETSPGAVLVNSQKTSDFVTPPKCYQTAINWCQKQQTNSASVHTVTSSAASKNTSESPHLSSIPTNSKIYLEIRFLTQIWFGQIVQVISNNYSVFFLQKNLTFVTYSKNNYLKHN